MKRTYRQPGRKKAGRISNQHEDNLTMQSPFANLWWQLGDPDTEPWAGSGLPIVGDAITEMAHVLRGLDKEAEAALAAAEKLEEIRRNLRAAKSS